MKEYLAYIRVSTVKQGERGSSLQEQRDAITQFAKRNELHIAQWFEERETAAKIGRSQFNRMLAVIKKGGAQGVIFHKIDRSARNLRDWSAIQDLADRGIDVRFTQESVNLSSNEGRLTGDFLAVISAHDIRNLREEVKKGMRGRLKQGLYPLAAPVGYLDQGGGKPKIPDPIRAPLIKDAYKMYATGEYSLHALSAELYRRGLRNRAGKKIAINRISETLRNPFYMGVIRMKSSGETYQGIHEAIVSKPTFDQVQDVLHGRVSKRTANHQHTFSRMIACAHCNYHLIAERQKGHVYYRCHTRECPTTSVREEVADSAIQDRLVALSFDDEDMAWLTNETKALAANQSEHRENRAKSIQLQLDAVNGRLARLMDAYLDDTFDTSLLKEKQLALIMERRALEDEHRRNAAGENSVAESILEYLELLNGLPLRYETGNREQKRQLVKDVSSNLSANGRNVAVELRSPFREIAELEVITSGAPLRNDPRTFMNEVFDILVKHHVGRSQSSLVAR
jgi:site-specific DNA recombinase